MKAAESLQQLSKLQEASLIVSIQRVAEDENGFVMVTEADDDKDEVEGFEILDSEPEMKLLAVSKHGWYIIKRVRFKCRVIGGRRTGLENFCFVCFFFGDLGKRVKKWMRKCFYRLYYLRTNRK